MLYGIVRLAALLKLATCRAVRIASRTLPRSGIQGIMTKSAIPMAEAAVRLSKPAVSTSTTS